MFHARSVGRTDGVKTQSRRGPSTPAALDIPVKVYDTDDVSADSASFLGTESLIRADRYHGQPCLPGHGDYFFLLDFGGAQYYACHHY